MITLVVNLLETLIRLYIWTLIAAALFSTLVSFGVLDTRNRLVWTIGDFLYRATEPMLRPIRRWLPNFGNLDLSPLVAILALELLSGLLERLAVAVLTGTLQPLLF